MREFGFGAVLRPDLALLTRHPELYGDDDASRSVRLAEALGCGPLWSHLGSRFAVAVRTEPEPLIALLGEPKPEDVPRLRALGWQVRDCLDRLSPISLSRTVELCEILAERLRQRIGAGLASATVLAIPRGGLIAAGFVAHLLDLPVQDAVSASVSGDGLILAVDDCALSGARLRRWLAHHSGSRIVVAHLHSSPGLRAAVEQDERVLACVAAEDLDDHAPRLHADGYETWVARWRERCPDDYWTGHPDLVAYVWNEPDSVLWNDVTVRAEVGWRVVPPQWCLKNRAPAASARVQVCRPGPGPLRPAPEVVWALLGERVLVADAASGTAGGLSAVGAACWLAIAATGDPGAAAGAVAADYGQPVEPVRADLDRFVSHCRERGLLRISPQEAV